MCHGSCRKSCWAWRFSVINNKVYNHKKGLLNGDLFYFRPMNISSLYSRFLECSEITTDSRNVPRKSLFVALKGPNFNGNDFVLEVLNNQALYAIADENRPEFKADGRIIIVDNALKALQDLATHHRMQFKIPIIGLTGSNGKTTTKELTYAALSKRYKALATSGNLNNHIGVPLTLLKINKEHEIAIIEMGANHRGEIALLSNIAKPDYGCITNIGLAHLEGFGSEEGVFIGKKELFDFVNTEGGKLFVNADDAKVVRAANEGSVTTFGKNSSAHFIGEPFIKDGFLGVRWWRNTVNTKYEILTKLTGTYNFSNVMAAIAIARFFGVEPDKINLAISEYQPKNNRSQIQISALGNTLIVDCYNANPSSMEAALTNLSEQEMSKKVAILGDMFELGENADEEHKKTLHQALKLGLEPILVGETFCRVANDFPELVGFKSTTELADWLRSAPIQHAVVLLKGSRKMKLEQLLELL